jgi:N6-adenosine-specific RNA methylase IME4
VERLPETTRGATVTEYATVVADPPWSPSLGSTWRTARTDKARPQKHYATLTVAEIVALRPPAAKQAHLWLWCLNQHVEWGVRVAREWGFEPVQMLTWCKPGLGVGRFQCNTEQVLVARKGSRHGNPFGATGGTWFNWPRGRHSAKPDEFFTLVEQVSPGPYLEMYARAERPGWDHFGNEAPASIELVNRPVAPADTKAPS